MPELPPAECSCPLPSDLVAPPLCPVGESSTTTVAVPGGVGRREWVVHPSARSPRPGHGCSGFPWVALGCSGAIGLQALPGGLYPNHWAGRHKDSGLLAPSP